MKIKKLFGTKAFYISVISIALPIMLQQGLTCIVGLLDNIMVGKVSEDALAGVAVSNQILFIYNLIIFGGLAGPGIYVSQFFGSEDDEHLRQAFRFKILLAAVITVLSLIVFSLFKESLIGMVFSNEDVNEEIAIGEAVKYINIMLYSLPFFALSQIFSTSLREIGNTVIPMISGSIAIIINVILNYCLIFGNFSFPELGVEGAAIATVISRVIEALILFIFVCAKKMVFINDGIFKLHIDKGLFKEITKKGMPLLLNEFLWSTGFSMIVFCYAFRGKAVISAVSIATVVHDFNFVVINGLASAISILVGKNLGANKLEEAKENSYKLMTFAILICSVLGIISAFLMPNIISLYNISEESAILAKRLIYVVCFSMPLSAFFLSVFFTIRAGGKSLYTMAFDSLFLIAIVLPFAFILCRYTSVYIVWIYLLVNLFDLVKGFIGLFIIKHVNWANNLAIQNVN